MLHNRLHKSCSVNQTEVEKIDIFNNTKSLRGSFFQLFSVIRIIKNITSLVNHYKHKAVLLVLTNELSHCLKDISIAFKFIFESGRKIIQKHTPMF